MELTEKMNEYIERNRVPKGQLARKSGMTENALSLSLNGRRKLNAEEYISICNALCVPYDLFVPDTDKAS